MTLEHELRTDFGDPLSEQLSPLAAAEEFTRICEMLDERHMSSFQAEEDYWESGKRIFAGDPTKRLGELLSQYYAGTPTARKRLLTEGFIKHGYNMGDVVSDIPFGNWPGDLGMDIENGSAGVFEREGARKIERTELLFWLPIEIDFDLAGMMGSLSGDPKKSIEAFLQQIEEYEKVFGEPYDSPREEDTEHERVEAEKAKATTQKLKKILERLGPSSNTRLDN